MPAKSKFKTEEDYRRAMKRESENLKFRREMEKKEEMKKTSECKIYARLPLRELAEEEQKLCEYTKGEIWRNETAKAANDLRYHLRRKWGAENSGQSIVVVDYHIYPRRGFASLRVELTAYGGCLYGEWLRTHTKEAGFEISSYIPKAER